VAYGDGGWLTDADQPPVTVTKITLDMATFLSPAPGSTALVFTLNDGDPSGLVLRSGNQLYTVTIPNVSLPAAPFPAVTYLELTVPLPNVQTLGGYNFAVGRGCTGVANFAVTIDTASCVGDDDGSGVVDAADLGVFLGQWRGSGSADFNGNGVVDAQDLGILLGAWGPCS